MQVEAYDADELNYHGGMRVSFGMQLIEASNHIKRLIPDITWPFLLLHGDADKLCDIGGSQLMYDQAKSSDKTLKVGVNLRSSAMHHTIIYVTLLCFNERKKITFYMTKLSMCVFVCLIW